VNGTWIEPTSGLTIERLGDPIWTGALIGFGAGLAAMNLYGRQGCVRAGYTLQASVELAMIGALIDWAHEGRRVIFRAARRADHGGFYRRALTQRSRSVSRFEKTPMPSFGFIAILL
jgi:hypothetical protein